MATVTGFTADRMLDIENASIVDGEVVGDNLILTTHGGTEINAGNVRGAVSPTSVDPVGDTVPMRNGSGRVKTTLPFDDDDSANKEYVDIQDGLLDVRLDTLEAGLTSIDASSWIQAGYGVFDAVNAGPLRALYNPVTRWIEVSLYVKRTGANLLAAVFSPILVPLAYRPQYRETFLTSTNINGAGDWNARTVLLHKTEANAGRIDMVTPLVNNYTWSTNQYAFIKAGWRAAL